MSFKLKLFISPWRDPFRNLAFEDQLLKNIRPSEKYLLVYQNDPCVVMGRFQNPWREVNLEFLENNQSHLKLVRRQSGGGCVYHDLGNMCFSFIHPSRDHHKDDNNKIIEKKKRYSSSSSVLFFSFFFSFLLLPPFRLLRRPE